MKANIWWGEEINSCNNCRYSYDYLDCKYNDDISIVNLDLDEIHKDCPFLKPVTKKFIESLGFKQDNNHDWLFTKKMFEPKDSTLSEDEKYWIEITLYDDDDIGITILDNVYNENKVKIEKIQISNQEHFKFILKSLEI